MLGPLSLVPGMRNIEQLACCLVCITATTAAAYFFRQHLIPPHPTECIPVCADCYFKLGWHEHHPFRMDFEILTAEGVPTSSKKYEVRLSTGKSSSTILSEDSRVFNSMGSLMIRSCDKEIFMTLVESGVSLNKADLGAYYLNIDTFLKENSWPVMNKKIPLIREDGRLGARIVMNVYFSVDVKSPPGLIPIESLALKRSRMINANKELNGGKGVRLDITKMKPLGKLRFYSRALDGPVVETGARKKIKYMRVKETSVGRFVLQVFAWSYGADGLSAASGCPEFNAKPELQVSIMDVSAVQMDPNDADCFSLRLRIEKKSITGTKSHVNETYRYKRVDRPREVWVDGFTHFISGIRRYKDAKLDPALLEALNQECDAENAARAAALECSPLYEQNVKRSEGGKEKSSSAPPSRGDEEEEEEASDDERTPLKKEGNKGKQSAVDVKKEKNANQSKDVYFLESQYYNTQGRSEVKIEDDQAKLHLQHRAMLKQSQSAAVKIEANSTTSPTKPSETQQVKSELLKSFLKNQTVMNKQAPSLSELDATSKVFLNDEEREAIDGLNFDDEE
eukprot:GDKK01072076.1.p1 GENE.GDKK01072076.1~~GDKK01072076.1.p1  ORF type:complete len:566 (-),score=107.52 GDKK01072076.1:361-2058(-)